MPLKVALTGGIATGKSHCLARFAALGAPVIDADELSHMAIEPGAAGYQAVVERFGDDVVGADGRIDRLALGGIVFADPDARHDLERIIHPAVYAAIMSWFTQLATWSGAKLGIADVPLLYETGHDRDFDRVIVTSCAPEQQIARLAARGMAAADAERRLAAQLPTSEKASRANYVIDTSSTFEETDRQIADVWLRLRTYGGR